MAIIDQQTQLLSQIRLGERDAVKQVYELTFHYCASFVLKNSGTREDAREIFQESLLVFLKKVRDPDFQIEYSLKGYLYAISKNLWLKQLRKKRKEGLQYIVDDPEYKMPIVAEDDMEERSTLEAQHQQLYDCMKKLNEDCQKLLDLTFYKKMSDKEIAPIMTYSAGFVRQKRRRCIGSLKKLLAA